ncbi:tripartite tricarboxylate transporter permease [uncultured Cohaesibacter sp.]|uniref:tripartite tricarboxylate transporter permease n=1 Tax=uncultured Cohaesibacter sp. TaxID=1002546 RepID=UPI0029C96938|nr:tripartite tricarboxylate transporter permease [uncultured Cohaesibacter sp.]
MLDSLSHLMLAFTDVATPENLLLIFVAGLIGTLVGALPGLGPSAGIALMMPLTFGMNPISGLSLLTGVYMGTMYGGRLTAILINTPGDAPAIVTAMEGYPMMQKGLGGQALGISAIASFVGGIFGLLMLIFFAPIIAEYAIFLGPPEYFMLMLLGLSMIIVLAGSDPLKALIATAAGVLLSTIGSDYVSGNVRFAVVPELIEGVDFVAVIIGLFGIGEVLVNVEERIRLNMGKPKFKFSEFIPGWAELRHISFPTLRGSVIGTAIGVLPGAGATIATFIAYITEKKLSRQPDNFGKGASEGLASPEAANNAAVPGSLIPLLTLGIPGSGGTAIMLGALIMFGLNPGPMLMIQSADIVWGTIAGLTIANLFLLASNILLIPVFVNALRLIQNHLNAIVVAFCLVGAFSINYGTFDVWITAIFGIIGYLMKRANYPTGPFILALVLAPLAENYLRQSIMLGQGSWGIFVQKPLTMTFTILVLGVVAFGLAKAPFTSYLRKKRLQAA